MQATITIPENIVKQYHLQKSSYSWVDLKTIFWEEFLTQSDFLQEMDWNDLTEEEKKLAEAAYNKPSSELLNI